jgi:SAF domain
LTSLRTGPRQPGPSLRPIGSEVDPRVDGAGTAVPPLQRRRNLSGAALGVLLVAVCAFGVASWASTVGHRTQVVVVTREVPAGSVIQAADLTTAGVAADHEVSAIPASAAAQEVGRVARVELLPGSLLERSQVGTGPAIPAGSSVVGLDLKGGAFPAQIGSGSAVEVVSTPSEGNTLPAGTVLAQSATVLSVAANQDGTSTLISIVVPAGEASAIASAGAAGAVSLVMLPGAGG